MTLGTDTVSFVGKLHSKLQIDCTYTHKPGDKHFLTEVVMKNIAAEDYTMYAIIAVLVRTTL